MGRDPVSGEAHALPPALVRVFLQPITVRMLPLLRADSELLADRLSAWFEVQHGRAPPAAQPPPSLEGVRWDSERVPAPVSERLLRFPLLPSSQALAAARHEPLVLALLLLHRGDRAALRFCQRAQLIEFVRRRVSRVAVRALRIGDPLELQQQQQLDHVFSDEEEDEEDDGSASGGGESGASGGEGRN